MCGPASETQGSEGKRRFSGVGGGGGGGGGQAVHGHHHERMTE